MPITLYVDPGLKSLKIEPMFAGQLASGRTCIKVDTENSKFSNKAAHLDMLALNAALIYYTSLPETTALNPIWVEGHSRGAQIIYKWIREMGPDSLIDPDLVVFYTSGCPEQKFTGASVLWPNEDKPKYPGIDPWTADSPTAPEHHGGFGVGYGLPLLYEIPWKIYCIAKQFDGWADAPELWDQAPIKETFLGFIVTKRWITPGNILSPMRNGDSHTFAAYTMALDDEKAIHYVDPDQPNVTYIWLPVYPIPSAESSKWLRYWARYLDEKGREDWDECWPNRPVTIPPPDYASIPSWIDYR